MYCCNALISTCVEAMPGAVGAAASTGSRTEQRAHPSLAWRA